MGVKVFHANAKSTRPTRADTTGLPSGYFSVTTSLADATDCTPDVLNDVIEEINTAITDEGGTVSTTNAGQLGETFGKMLRHDGTRDITGELAFASGVGQTPLTSTDRIETTRYIQPNEFLTGNPHIVPWDSNTAGNFYTGAYYDGTFWGTLIRQTLTDSGSDTVTIVGPYTLAIDDGALLPYKMPYDFLDGWVVNPNFNDLLDLGGTSIPDFNILPMAMAFHDGAEMFIPISIESDKRIKSMRLYGASYDAVVARELLITFEKKAISSISSWTAVEYWTKTFSTATAGTGDFGQMAPYTTNPLGVSPGGDYWFHTPVANDWLLTPASEETISDGYVYRLRVRLTNDTTEEAYPSPHTLNALFNGNLNPFAMVGILGLKVVCDQQKFIL